MEGEWWGDLPNIPAVLKGGSRVWKANLSCTATT